MNDTFGRRARACATPVELLALEHVEGADSRFSTIDTLIAGLTIRAARGEPILEIQEHDLGRRLSILGMPEVLRASMREAFHLETQQARGAWFLPKDVSINAMWICFSANFRKAPRYAHTLAYEARARVELSDSPDAMVAWAILQPLFEQLFAPIRLRAERSGSVPKDEFKLEWDRACSALNALGFQLAEALLPFEWGQGWGKLRSEQQLVVKERYLVALRGQLDRAVVLRFRASVVSSLVAQYYSKAKNGRAKRKSVLTKQFVPALAAFFGGSWLAFLDYLGELPHDEERILMAAPEPRIVVEDKAKAAEIAAKKKLPVEEVEKILGVYWQGAGGSSPVLERAAVLSEYWSHFERMHAQQAPGMRPLWGLVEDAPRGYEDPDSGSPYQSQLYREVLPTKLLSSIERMWGTTVLTKWPECVVSEPYPHFQMAATFGPGLKFWNGCGLTAWFVCEGPMSRTDVPGLAAYFRRELAELEDLGCPVERKLFDELNAVKLGKEESIYAKEDKLDVGFGMSIGFQMSVGTRRKGFEKLRDVITRYRQAWATKYLTLYIRTLWERELKAAGREYHLMSEEKGKSPTLKQFAKHALEPARHWFGGDMALLYAALGQKLNVAVRRSLRMPADRTRFVKDVFVALGGEPFKRNTVLESEDERNEQNDAHAKAYALQRAASDALLFVQLSEALGRTPTPKEFGNRIESYSAHLANDGATAWDRYTRAIDSILGHSASATGA